jgi:hypothetical protein
MRYLCVCVSAVVALKTTGRVRVSVAVTRVVAVLYEFA